MTYRRSVSPSSSTTVANQRLDPARPIVAVLLATALVIPTGCGGPDESELGIPATGAPGEALIPSDEGTTEDALFAHIVSPAIRVCKRSNMRGPCTYRWTTDLDLANDRWSDGSRMNDSITSIRVYSGYEITVCRHRKLGGTCKHLGQNTTGYYWNMARLGIDNVVSSIEVRSNNPIWRTSNYRRNYPHDRQNTWSNEAQGVTHDANNWYISNKWHIHKYPVGRSVSSNNYSRRSNLPSGCNHVGDLDYYGGNIYAPLEGCRNYEDRIYVYDTNLNKVRHGFLVDQNSASWVAVNPVGGHMYTSDFNTRYIHVYDRNFGNRTLIRKLYSIRLDRNLKGIQGGVFSDNGYLYLTTHKGQAGIHVFKIRGRNATRVKFIGPNGYKPGFPNYEEIEGITLWNLDNGRAPGISGQIHWILLDNDSNDDDIYFKHIRVNDPSRL